MALDYRRNSYEYDSRAKNVVDVSEDLISPHPLDSGEVSPSVYSMKTDEIHFSSQAGTSDSSRRAEAFRELPSEVIERYATTPLTSTCIRPGRKSQSAAIV